MKRIEAAIHKEIRTKLFLTGTAFSEKYKISRATVSGWGHGKKISPKHCQLLNDLGISHGAIEKPYETLPSNQPVKNILISDDAVDDLIKTCPDKSVSI